MNKEDEGRIIYIVEKREKHAEIHQAIKNTYEGRQTAMDKSYPPIIDTMSTVFIYRGNELGIGSEIPKEMLNTGVGKEVQLDSYYLMKGVINPPIGQLVLIEAEEYAVKSVVGYKTPSKFLIRRLAEELNKEEEVISDCIRTIFKKSKFTKALFEWGRTATNVCNKISEITDTDKGTVSAVMYEMTRNFENKRSYYDLGPGFAIKAIIDEDRIYPLLRRAKGTEKTATRKKVRPNKHVLPFLRGQRTEVWPDVTSTYTETPANSKDTREYKERYEMPPSEEEYLNIEEEYDQVLYPDDDYFTWNDETGEEI